MPPQWFEIRQRQPMKEKEPDGTRAPERPYEGTSATKEPAESEQDRIELMRIAKQVEKEHFYSKPAEESKEYSIDITKMTPDKIQEIIQKEKEPAEESPSYVYFIKLDRYSYDNDGKYHDITCMYESRVTEFSKKFFMDFMDNIYLLHNELFEKETEASEDANT